MQKCDNCNRVATEATRDMVLSGDVDGWATWEPEAWRYGCVLHPVKPSELKGDGIPYAAKVRAAMDSCHVLALGRSGVQP